MSKIVDVFDNTCLKYAGKDAIYFYDKTLQKRTYSELKTDIDSYINYLIAAGVKSGDSVFLFAPASYKLVVFMIAAFKLGIQVMFLDIHARQETFDKLFGRFKPKYVLVSNKTKYSYLLFKNIRRELGILNLDKIKTGKIELKELPKIDDNAPALFTTTTGSTGLPKIIVRSQLDLFNQLELIDKNLPKDKCSVIMSTAFIYIFAILASGDTAVLPQINLNASAKKINKHLQAFKNIPISIIITSPVFGLKASNVFPKLKLLYVGGASITLQEAEKIQRKYADSKTLLVYGATECNIMAWVTLSDYVAELRKNCRSTLGKPFDGVSIKISDDESILVSCDALIKGFVDEKSEHDIRDGNWYDTNDKGYIENGMLYYRGKFNYFITFNEKKYYSHEIEQFLSVKFPTYKKCAVVQKKDKIYLFGSERKYAGEIKSVLFEKYGFKVEYKYISKLPHDVRHYTKTDYKKLLSLV